jgi:hypothetical protein
METRLPLLYQLLEEEIAQYRLLIEETKEESNYLRKGSIDGLLKSVRSLERHTDAIHKVHDSIRNTIAAILISRGKDDNEYTLSGLLAVLPVEDGRKIRLYQGTLERLKEWASLVNRQNKIFIQESLSYCKSFFSLLIQPWGESSVYSQSGQKRSSTFLPQSLNRKV